MSGSLSRAGGIALFLASVTAAETQAVLYPDLNFVRLPFNTTGTAEIGSGFIGGATPVDADGDGDWDLSVCGSGYGGEEMFYENTGDPLVLKRGVHGKNFFAAWRFSMLDDKRYALTSPDARVVSRIGAPVGESSGLGVGLSNVHWGPVWCNSWLSKDFDGDGREDLLIGIGDWREYGWHQRYDGIRQAWTNANCRGLVYLLRNLGESKGKPQWSEPSLLRIENGLPVETLGIAQAMLEDWDGDGDFDLIVSDFPGNYTYFENVGTRRNPVYTSGRLLHDTAGALLSAPECIPLPQAVDWDRDGKIDFIAAQEDGRVAFYRNADRLVKGMPVFEPPVFLRAGRDDLRFGSLVSPCVCDFDGDGDQDIVVGDAAGYLAWFENVSGAKVAHPKWEGPHYLECAEPTGDYVDVTVRPDTFQCRPFKHRAGHNGSIQGPVEAGFGYTCETVADWDGDGDLDIIYNQIWGKPMLLENVGTRTKPRFAAPHGIEVEWGDGGQPELKWAWLTPARTGHPKEIVTQWRTTPVMIDLNEDGLMDLVMADTEGYLAFFERYRENGRLKLKAPRRALLDAKSGRPMGVTGWGEGNGSGSGGDSGRRKICFADWDGDGKLDLLMNGSKNVVLWTQTSAKDGFWSFARQDEMTEQPIQYHSTCPSACDFDGDGIADLVLGAEDGYLYHLSNPRSRKSLRLPDGASVGFSLQLGKPDRPAPEKTVRASDMRTFSVSTNAAGAIGLAWRGHPDCGEDFTVRASLCPEEGDWRYDFSYERNEGGYDIEDIRFPELTVPRDETTRLLYPNQSGMIRLPKWKGLKPREEICGCGPLFLGFRFVATLDGEGRSWYVDQRDDARNYVTVLRLPFRLQVLPFRPCRAAAGGMGGRSCCGSATSPPGGWCCL